MDRDQWYDCIIAQDDDFDYSESGWVAFHYEGGYYLAQYSHCSCYDTFEALNFDPVNNVRWLCQRGRLTPKTTTTTT